MSRLARFYWYVGGFLVWAGVCGLAYALARLARLARLQG